MPPDESQGDDGAMESPAAAPSSTDAPASGGLEPSAVPVPVSPSESPASDALSGATLVGVTPPISVEELRALAAARSGETALVRPNVTQLGRRAAWEIRRHASNDNHPPLTEAAKTIPVAPTLPVVWKEGKRILREREAATTRTAEPPPKRRKRASWREHWVFLLSVVGGCLIGVGIAVFGLVVLRGAVKEDPKPTATTVAPPPQPAPVVPKQALTIPGPEMAPATESAAVTEEPSEQNEPNEEVAKPERSAKPRPGTASPRQPDERANAMGSMADRDPDASAAKLTPPPFVEQPNPPDGRAAARDTHAASNGIAKSPAKKVDPPTVDPDAVLPLSLD